MANTLRTRQGYEYWIQDGKYIYDYDLFDTLEELEEEQDPSGSVLPYTMNAILNSCFIFLIKQSLQSERLKAFGGL